MIGFRLDQTKGLFFDKPRVVRAVDVAAKRVLSRFGAFVRTRARTSIRKRKKSSAPGRPPSSHAGTLKRLILFAYEAARKNVAIGPLLAERKTRDGAPLRGTVPETLEYGGAIQIEEYQRGFTPAGRKMVESMGRDPDAWHRIGKKRLWHKKGQPLRIRARRKRIITIAPRPFMRPAFAAERPKLEGMWADSIK